MTEEKRLETKFIGRLRDQAMCIKLDLRSFSGMPDRLILRPGGKVWFVEFKSQAGKLSPRQQLVQARLISQGMNVRNVNPQNHQEVLDEILAS